MQNCNFAWCFMYLGVELGRVTLREKHRLIIGEDSWD